MPKPVLLIVDDDTVLQRNLVVILGDKYDVRTAVSMDEAMSRLLPLPDVVLLDLRLDAGDPQNRDGERLLSSLRKKYPQLPVVMMSAFGDTRTAVACITDMGAADFLVKPLDGSEVIEARLRNAVDKGRLLRENAQLKQDREDEQLIGSSAAMQEVLRRIKIAALDGSVSVLIQGETGTGKELVARAIYNQGIRATGPLKVRPLMMPSTVADIELFGTVQGAFTDAVDHMGVIEAANRGVLFLDEIDKAAPDVQAKLLRFLQEREVQRLGSNTVIPVDVQVLSATNVDLTARMEAGEFPSDLYYRLCETSIFLPPLRERREDIPLLVDHFLARLRQLGKRVHRITPNALRAMQHFPWPGNVRQLRSQLEDTARFVPDHRDIIELDDLPAEVRSYSPHEASLASRPKHADIGETLAQTQLAAMDHALKRTGGVKSKAWEIAGYKNRFAFYRTAKQLLSRYPQLAQEYPHVILAFAQSHDD